MAPAPGATVTVSSQAGPPSGDAHRAPTRRRDDLLVGLLVTILALYAPEAGAAVVGAATVVALLAELTARK
ncbi:hypothetical protein GCM10010247_13990 [Streptomyces calvus]|nr:hypothetical protein GCM10010247_13990 [Streptomyces calvus]